MSLVNINYKARVLENVDKLPFNKWKPRQFVKKCPDFSIIIFPTGKCRIMGCKKPIECFNIERPFKIKVETIQSLTIVDYLNESVNLYKLSCKIGIDAMFEPEIFPALRVLKYNPLCVNVFSSGKVMIFGIKSLKYESITNEIKNYIKQYI